MSVAIIAHRGASGITGEDNTLRSFRLAIDLGCDFVETDVRRTRDGRLVCFHDEAVRGVPRGRVRDLTLEELRAASGIDVPTLEDTVHLFEPKEAGCTGLDLELKEAGYERDVLDITHRESPRPELVVTSFLEEAVGRFASLAPDIETGLIVGKPAAGPGVEPNDAAFAELAARLERCGAKFLALHHRWLCPGLFESADLAQVPVWVWTLNSPARIAEVLRFPVHAIATDRPDYAAEILRRPTRVRTSQAVKARARGPDIPGLVAFLSGSEVDGTPVPTRHVRVGRGVISETPDWVASLFGSRARVGVVMDPNTREAAGHLVLGMLAGGSGKATPVVLQPLSGRDRITPHESFADLVARGTEHCDAMIAVGSGTVNDITKYAADRAGKPYLAVATAASMNGYTSSIAALLVNGLKVTLPCRPPVVVIGDTEVLAAAPPDMARSGYADCLSKTVATADWRMASFILGEPFSDLPGAVAEAAVDRCVDAAEGIGAGDLEAIETLMQALALSGYSMTLAGSSAPASGGEHLISHLWDMLAYAEGREPALHGLQVGLGTLVTSRLYELLREEDPAGFAPEVRTEDDLRVIWGDLWTAIEDEARKQILSREQAAARVDRIRESWDAIWRELDRMLVPAEEIRRRLGRAGVATSPEGVTPAGRPPHDNYPDRAAVRHALLHAADIRARYTVLDLARDTGVLPRAAEEVLGVF